MMHPAKQTAPGKVVLLPAHRGTVSSGAEGVGSTLEGTAVSSKSGKQLASMYECLKVAHMRNSYQKLELIKVQAQQRCLY